MCDLGKIWFLRLLGEYNIIKIGIFYRSGDFSELVSQLQKKTEQLDR